MSECLISKEMIWYAKHKKFLMTLSLQENFLTIRLPPESNRTKTFLFSWLSYLFNILATNSVSSKDFVISNVATVHVAQFYRRNPL
ncbi:hypothetical protein BX666DRAFT_1887978 [Dichotomocladium elegans]|nr:hypothetical protein BX666DRAFT_1887978 [Dichotomocladium elegans]